MSAESDSNLLRFSVNIYTGEVKYKLATSGLYNRVSRGTSVLNLYF